MYNSCELRRGWWWNVFKKKKMESAYTIIEKYQLLLKKKVFKYTFSYILNIKFN